MRCMLHGFPSYHTDEMPICKAGQRQCWLSDTKQESAVIKCGDCLFVSQDLARVTIAGIGWD
eukprot:scaffold562920_cov15-Prasinocladus_malaysianus.AAC.1